MIWVLSVHSIFANRCKLLESLVKHAKSMTAVCYPTDDEAATETHRNSFAAMLVPAGWLYDQSHGQWLKIVHWLLWMLVVIVECLTLNAWSVLGSVIWLTTIKDR